MSGAADDRSEAVTSELPANNTDQHTTKTLLPTAPSRGLDELILESISQFYHTYASSPDVADRVTRLITSILIVGATSNISKLPLYVYNDLTSKLLDWWLSHDILASYKDYQGLLKLPSVGVLQYPREIEPKVVVWKGAAVLAKLEIGREMSVSRDEFARLGLRCVAKGLVNLSDGDD